MDAGSADDARRALAVVEADALARERFVAAFHADGDAVAILRETLHPDAAAQTARDRELDDLRRTAFGRTTTPAEEATAAAAHAAMADAERAQSERRAALTAAVVAVLAVESAPQDASPGSVGLAAGGDAAVLAAGVIPKRARWRRLVAPLGTFLLGVGVAAAVVAFASGSAVAPVTTPTVNPGDDTLVIPGEPLAGSAHPGDIDAAERWLARPQTEADLIPGGLDAIAPSSTHLAFGGAAGSVWVARGADGELCVIASTQVDGVRASSCSPPENFTLHGAMVAVGGLVGTPSIEATWDGANVYLTVGSGE